MIDELGTSQSLLLQQKDRVESLFTAPATLLHGILMVGREE